MTGAHDPTHRADVRPGPAADVGRWFSTAAPLPRGRAIPRTPVWAPIPGHEYGHESGTDVLGAALDLIRDTPTAVLTGAGMSTGSGLPDYRGRDAVPRTPMTVQEFLGSDLARRRYWARSTVGWVNFGRARPNAGHRALARIGELTELTGIITQNVDALHQQAGSHPVVDLHGRLDVIRCVHCGDRSSRDALHSRMLAINPQFAARLPTLTRDAEQAPDGDAEVDRTADFRYPPCPICGGILKPDVVFFGESAHPEAVAEAFAVLGRAGTLLVLGSSLTVQSGLRFVRRAVRDGTAVVILNDGPTRADDLATVRVHGRLETVLARWADELAAS